MMGLLNVTQAAAFLNISKRRLWTLTKCGDVIAVRSGRRVLYEMNDLQTYVNASKRKGARRA